MNAGDSRIFVSEGRREKSVRSCLGKMKISKDRWGMFLGRRER